MRKKPSPQYLALKQENETLKKKIAQGDQDTMTLHAMAERVKDILLPEMQAMIDEAIDAACDDLQVTR